MKQGIHHLLNLHKCKKNLVWDNTFNDLMLAAINAENLDIVDTGFKQFNGGGYTAYFLLAESHISIHTWPEIDSVYADVFVCNYTKNNTQAAQNIQRFLINFFDAQRPEIQCIER